MPVLYYAHSIKKYNTPEEVAEINQIQYIFRDFKIINPKDFDWHTLQIFMSSFKQKYCLDFVRREVDILVFSEYDGHVGRGVYEEVKIAEQKGIPVWLLRVKESDAKFLKHYNLQKCDETDWAV